VIAVIRASRGGRSAVFFPEYRTPRCSAHLTTNRLLVSEEIGNFGFETRLSLADITFVSKAIRTTVLANAFDMNVSTAGGRLFLRRSGCGTMVPGTGGAAARGPC
jgi:hypothetical protein